MLSGAKYYTTHRQRSQRNVQKLWSKQTLTDYEIASLYITQGAKLGALW